VWTHEACVCGMVIFVRLSPLVLTCSSSFLPSLPPSLSPSFPQAALLKSYIQEHVQMTGSEVGKKVLAEWPAPIHQFVKVMPIDYKRVLRQLAEEGEEENSGDEAQVAISY